MKNWMQPFRKEKNLGASRSVPKSTIVVSNHLVTLAWVLLDSECTTQCSDTDKLQNNEIDSKREKK